MDEFGRQAGTIAEAEEGERNEQRTNNKRSSAAQPPPMTSPMSPPVVKADTGQTGFDMENGRPYGDEADDAGCCKCIIM
jgi:hypothetical protein